MNEIQKDFREFYQNYVQSLPLDTLVKEALMSKQNHSSDFQFYLFYPRLFSESFGIPNNEDLRLLCVSGFLYYQSLVNLDQAFDSGGKSLNLRNMLLVSSCQEESLKILGHLFSPNSIFWKLWTERKMNYYNAIDIEKLSRVSNESEYHKLADYKSAFGKVAIDALHVMSKEKHKTNYQNLLIAHRHFSIANQLIDDVQDIIPDLEQGQFNWVYKNLIDFLKKNEFDHNSLTKDQIKKYLYSSNLATSFYRKASKFYDKSIAASADTGAILWLNVLNGLKCKNEERIDNIYGYKKIIETRSQIRLSKTFKSSQNIFDIPKYQVGVINITGAIKFLIDEQRSGFPDLKHIMYLSKIEGFTDRSKIHIGEIFQRAIVLDTLCDLQTGLKIDLKDIINEEIRFLKSSRRKDSIGAWCYFPSVSEIASDIDDLGQVIQVLIKSKQTQFLDKYCFKLIDFTLSNCSIDNGGIKTWILPKDIKNEYQQKQQLFNQTKWGEGPDVEVVANFIYSLILTEKNQYKDSIYRACKYIKNSQDATGYWRSKWYYGNYYGTYVCVRALKGSNKSFDESIKKAISYIINSQNSNGGWGFAGSNSDALNTSFCLLTLKLFDNKKMKKYITRAEQFLHSSQNEDGAWSAVNFIRPRINDPYRSKTLTTAYVLKALTM